MIVTLAGCLGGDVGGEQTLGSVEEGCRSGLPGIGFGVVSVPATRMSLMVRQDGSPTEMAFTQAASRRWSPYFFRRPSTPWAARSRWSTLISRISSSWSITSRQAKPTSDAWLRHQIGVRIGKAIFSGG